MASFNIVFWCKAIVCYPFLFQRVDRICLLQERIPNVFFIDKYLAYVTLMPLRIPCTVENSICFESPLDLKEAPVVRILNEDLPGCLRLFGVVDKIPAPILRLFKECFEVLVCNIPRLYSFSSSFNPDYHNTHEYTVPSSSIEQFHPSHQ